MSLLSKLLKGHGDGKQQRWQCGRFLFSLTRVYFQSVIAVNLESPISISFPMLHNLNVCLKCRRKMEKLISRKKSRARKMLMQDYGLNENSSKKLMHRSKRVLETPNDIQAYLFMYQGFSNDLMMLDGKPYAMEIPHTFIIQKILKGMTEKPFTKYATKKVWKADDVHKTATAVKTV